MNDDESFEKMLVEQSQLASVQPYRAYVVRVLAALVSVLNCTRTAEEADADHDAAFAEFLDSAPPDNAEHFRDAVDAVLVESVQRRIESDELIERLESLLIV